MTMPNMTGDQLASKMMAIRPDIPIIIYTGYSELMTEERARALGIRGFAEKPVIMKDMARIIRTVIDKS